MKYLKKYIKFFEDGESGSGDVSATANTSGMGAVVSAQPSALPGKTGTTGSGDVGFTFKKEKRKKGDPSEVSDLRDLEDADVVNIKESSVSNIIEDCLMNLTDLGFKYTPPLSDSLFEVLLTKDLNQIWTGNLTIKVNFNKQGVLDKDIVTLRPSGKELSESEIDLLEESIDSSLRMINLLGYGKGRLVIKYKKDSVSILILLIDIDKLINESGNEIIQNLVSYLKTQNFSPLEINKIVDSYSDMIDKLEKDGINDSLILKEIIDLLPERTTSSFLSFKGPKSGWNNTTYL